MKLTKSKLTEMIKQELKEISTAAGGSGALTKQKKARADVTTKSADKTSSQDTWDAAIATYDTAADTYSTATDDYNDRMTDLNAFTRFHYQKAVKGGGYLYSPTAAVGYSHNPDWTRKQNAANSAREDQATASNAKDTAAADRDTAKGNYTAAVSDLSSAEKTEKAIKAKTHFGYGAGAGGRKGGKGGTAKKGKKKESLHRILGRDLIKEFEDIKKYK